MLALTIDSLDAMRAVAESIAGLLTPEDVLEFEGDVGAGKTTTIGALASALGSVDPVRSPTFTVAHEYQLASGKLLAHLDLYRQHDALDEAAWGYIEPAFDAAYVCVEWPAPVRAWYVGRPVWTVQLSVLPDGARRLMWIDAPEADRRHALARQLSTAGAVTA
jgi:tRNA threonylcarbamoyl adenosine modification protein YjeE